MGCERESYDVNVSNNAKKRRKKEGSSQDKKKTKKRKKVKEDDEAKDNDDEKEEKEDVDVGFKATKIRVYPTPQQKKILGQWFGTSRWIYNKCAHAFNERSVKPNKKDMRAAFINNPNYEDDNKWVLDTPYDIRDEAMNDILKAFKAYNAKKEVNKNGFRLKYRRKQDNTYSLTVLAKHWEHRSGAYASVFGSRVLRSRKSDPLPVKLPHDSRLIKERTGKYFMCIATELDIYSCTAQLAVGKVVAIDPGVRTFLTTYDQDGNISEWGSNDKLKLFRLAKCVDKISSKIDTYVPNKVEKTPRRWIKKAQAIVDDETKSDGDTTNSDYKKQEVVNRNKIRMKKARLRIYARIRNLVADVHKKACKWLLMNHQHILLPKFNSKDMCEKSKRKLHTKSVRSMLHWSHFAFRKRLLDMSSAYPLVQITLVDESYTSKTCGKCGTIKNNLGGAKTFKCVSNACGFTCDRDVNGARNILLKYMSEYAHMHIL